MDFFTAFFNTTLITPVAAPVPYNALDEPFKISIRSIWSTGNNRKSYSRLILEASVTGTPSI